MHLRDLPLSNRLVNRDELGAVGKGSLDLDLRNHRRHAVHHGIRGEDGRPEAHDLGDRFAVADELQELRRDERDRFGVIQLEPAAASLAGELAAGKDKQLVDFPRRQMHWSVPSAESYSKAPNGPGLEKNPPVLSRKS